MAMVTVMRPDGTHGEAADSELEKREYVIDNDHERTLVTEYRFLGSEDVVHRSVHVTIKEGLAAFPALESF